MARSIIPVLSVEAEPDALWPPSSRPLPPALTLMAGPQTPLQATLAAISDPAGALAAPVVIAPTAHSGAVLDQIQASGVRVARVVLTPPGTGPQAVAALAAFAADEVDPAAQALLLPAHWRIDDPAAFSASVRAAATDTGVVRFAEGAVLFRPGVLLDVFGEDRERIRDRASVAWFGARRDGEVMQLAADAFSDALSGAALDLLLQREGVRVSGDLEGAAAPLARWDEVWQAGEKDKDGNVTHGAVRALGCSDTLVRSDGLPVLVAGLDDVIVVVTEQGVLVTSRAFADEAQTCAPALFGSAPSVPTDR